MSWDINRLAIEIGWWSTTLSLERIDYVTFGLTTQLKTRHASCWSVPYITSLEIHFHQYLRM